MTQWVCTIETSSGDRLVSIHPDEDTAYHHAAGYAREWWSDAVDRTEDTLDPYPLDPPADDRETVELYFSTEAMGDQESCDIDETA